MYTFNACFLIDCGLAFIFLLRLSMMLEKSAIVSSLHQTRNVCDSVGCPSQLAHMPFAQDDRHKKRGGEILRITFFTLSS
jgi:hypothetical protein